ncbi:hypothetical protein CHS0354_036949 [Potamilus streckersoni]|uniref:Uncharacterized protein n=1 Tax=Potamilus streckersoni TaxID=2493646 RepID=A0AAE0TBI5_9BIVA|nr:hypothetical protein CHS0354_036949 [Potamilus streckersoni]
MQKVEIRGETNHTVTPNKTDGRPWTSHSESSSRNLNSEKSSKSLQSGKSRRIISPSAKTEKSEQQYAATRPPTTSILRSAIYYQNRIIVRDPPENRSRPSSSHESNNRSLATVLHLPENSPTFDVSTAHKRPENIPNDTGNTKSSCSVMEIDASSVLNMGGIDIVVTDVDSGEKNHVTNKYSIWKRIYLVLQDDRMRGRSDIDVILNCENQEKYRILKKVLNILFLTIGVVLLLAVIVVIIYTMVA